MNKGTALIFMTARNCEMYAAASLESLARQAYDRFHVLYIDDCSTDATGDIARRLLDVHFPERHTYIRNESQFGKARNAWEHLRPLAEAVEFIAVLDADDRLANPEILRLMSEQYASGNDVVWTNYVTDAGAVGGNAALDPTKSPRIQGWKTSHFFSFRAKFLKNVPEDYFKDSEGDWLPAACDIALAFPILDQTRRYHFIPNNAYIYTSLNPYSHHNMDPHSQGLNSGIQQKCVREILAKSPLPLIAPIQSEETKPLPSPHSSNRDIWGGKALDLLIPAAPALLSAHSVVDNGELSPLELWSLYQFMSRVEDGNILHVGAASSAVYLAALTSILPDRKLSCHVGSTEIGETLEAMLAASDLTKFATQLTGPVWPTNDQTEFAHSPNTDVLQQGERFSTVVIDARGMETSGLVTDAFPSVAPFLSPTSFRLCFMASDQSILEDLAHYWRERTTGIKFCLSGIGGRGLVVMGGL